MTAKVIGNGNDDAHDELGDDVHGVDGFDAYDAGNNADADNNTMVLDNRQVRMMTTMNNLETFYFDDDGHCPTDCKQHTKKIEFSLFGFF